MEDSTKEKIVEKINKNELSEEELNSVTGGASGVIPGGVMTYSVYDKPRNGYFYAKTENDKEDLAVVYIAYDGMVYARWTRLSYGVRGTVGKELTYVWTSVDNGTWIIESAESFKKQYPYELNIFCDSF